MMDYFNELNSKFGSLPEDIKNIYILVSDKGEIETVYIIFNSDKIDKINRPSNMPYKYFFELLSECLKNLGAKNSNKNDKWFVTKKINNWKINYDLLDKKYIEQNDKEIKEEDSYDILTIDKYVELDIEKDEEAKRKSKITENIVEAGILSLLIAYSYKTKGFINNYLDILITLDLFTITSAIFNKILLELDKKIIKDRQSDIHKLEKTL